MVGEVFQVVHDPQLVVDGLAPEDGLPHLLGYHFQCGGHGLADPLGLIVEGP